MALYVSSLPLTPKQTSTSITDNTALDDSLLRHYSLLASSFLNEDESTIESLPSLYFNDEDKGKAEEEEDTEDDEDNNNMLIKNIQQKPLPIIETSSCSVQPLLATAAATADASAHHRSVSMQPNIQTYEPQLNFSLYSPSPSAASSIRARKTNSSKSYRNYPSVASPNTTNTPYTAADAGQNSTFALHCNKKTPLYPTNTAVLPSSNTSTSLKMDIRSPPQPTQSSSRLMSAFQRLRNGPSNQRSSAVYHHQNTNNSVMPAEIIPSLKPSPSKSSLADKIKSKFHQQLEKKKNRSSLQEITRKKSISTFSIPRSASLSSMTQWSSRLSGGGSGNTKSTPLKKMSTSTNLAYSASVSSHLSASSIASYVSSSSSSSSCSSPLSSKDASSPEARMAPVSGSAFSLTKSISSHRLYNKTSSENINASKNSNYQRHSIGSRPRQTLRAINPNESVRLSMRQSAANGSTATINTPKKPSHGTPGTVRFAKLVSVRETFSKTDYDRGSDPEAVCTRLTPTMAQQIKEELNAYKLHEMQVHEYSRVHTHFFL